MKERLERMLICLAVSLFFMMLAAMRTLRHK